MEKMPHTPPETTINLTDSTILGSKTPPHNLPKPTGSPVIQKSASDIRKAATPDRLKVPKAFKYPERYTSPTDLMMSPVSRGLLARSRKPSTLLPPFQKQHNLQNIQIQEVGLFRT